MFDKIMLNRQTCNFGLDISRNRDKRTDIFSFFPYVIKEDENSGVKWINIEDVEKVSNEKWIKENIYRKLNEKLKNKEL